MPRARRREHSSGRLRHTELTASSRLGMLCQTACRCEGLVPVRFPKTAASSQPPPTFALARSRPGHGSPTRGNNWDLLQARGPPQRSHRCTFPPPRTCAHRVPLLRPAWTNPSAARSPDVGAPGHGPPVARKRSPGCIAHEPNRVSRWQECCEALDALPKLGREERPLLG